MDFYNLAFSCGINILVILLIEGLLYFVGLSLIFNNIMNSIITSGGPSINKLMNNNYDNIVGKMDTLPNNLLDSNFVTQITKLYLIGSFSNQIIKEDEYIKNNDLISYVAFTILLFCPLIFLVIVKLINYFVFDNKYSVNWVSILYSVLISLFILLIFILPLIFTVFVNLQDNVDTNGLQYSMLKLINKYFV